MLALLAASISAAQPEPGTGSIAGQVVHALTGAPVRKATVVLTAPAAPIRLVADTDAEGRFQFLGLPPGTYKLSATRAGFLERSARRPFTLAADAQVTDALIRIPPQSAIAGRILDEEGDPVPNAQVSIFLQLYHDGRRQWERVNTGNISNDAGEYRFANLTPGRYLVRAVTQRPSPDNRYGVRATMYYVPAYYPNAPSEAEALPIELAAGAELRGIDVHLFKRASPATFHVRGRVTGVQGAPQIGISLVPSNGANTVARAPGYEFDVMAAPGQYTVFAHVYSDGPEAYGSGTVSVSENVSNVLLSMAPPPDVTGHVTVADGAQAKLQGVTIVLKRTPAWFNQPVAYSDTAGRFTIPKPLPPGRYSLEVVETKVPESCFVQTVKLAGQEININDFEIRGSAELEVVLSATAGQITGSVTDEDGKSFANAIVTLIPAAPEARPTKQTADVDGNFRFTSLRPGKYRVFAWEELDQALWEDPDFRKPYEARSAEVTVGARENQTTQLRLIGR
jgi:protocatechuate 3,4-dioxygenase beta subunit